MKKNIVLIGMPGVGKSTIGVILAKVLGYNFIDTDLLIQEKENRLLNEIIGKDGIDYFLNVESKINQNLDVSKAIIATGGSVIYSNDAMEHLKELGKVIYLKQDFEKINERVENIHGRGVVLKDNQTFEQLYNERVPLYEKYADIIVEQKDLTIEETLNNLLNQLEDM